MLANAPQIHEALICHQEQCWIAPRVVVHEDLQCPGLLHLSHSDVECDFQEGMDVSQHGCDGSLQMVPCILGDVPSAPQNGDIENKTRVCEIS